MDKTSTLLHFDPLQAAEDLTGLDYKVDEATSQLGLGLALLHNAKKQAHLLEIDDTTYGDSLERYTRIIEGMGFEKVLEVPFMSQTFKDEEPRQEAYYIYAHKQRGLLLAFDTFYGGTSINGGTVYYCWKPNDITGGRFRYGLTSSGTWRGGDDGFWEGSHDCREAIRYKMDALAEVGTFISPWPAEADHFLWLLHHMDTKVDGYDYKAITEERITMMPEWVQEMLGR